MSSAKTFLKQKIGNNRIKYIRGCLSLLKKGQVRSGEKLQKMDEELEDIMVFSYRGQNVFNGYYDIDPLSADGKNILVQRVKKGASPSRDLSEIGLVNIHTGEYQKLTDTPAWSWQQGSRVRWSMKNPQCIYFNSIFEGEYVTVKYDSIENKIINSDIPALYDISKDEEFGLTLDFSRLQRLRPGYGYSKLSEFTPDEDAPENNGIWRVDFDSKKRYLMVSLKTLADTLELKGRHEHYINHISISPNGKKFMFFHIFTVDQRPGWKVNLCIMNTDGSDLKAYGYEFSASHYTWVNDDTLLLTGTDMGLNLSYRILHLLTGDWEILDNEELTKDGHPTCIYPNVFIADTYPDSNFYQKVFLYDYKKNYTKLLCKIFADPRLTGEIRCDLHPKVSVRGDKIYVFCDSTFQRCSRSICMLQLKREDFVNGLN